MPWTEGLAKLRFNHLLHALQGGVIAVVPSQVIDHGPNDVVVAVTERQVPGVAIRIPGAGTLFAVRAYLRN